MVLLIVGILTLAFHIESVKTEVQVGVKAGDWIKLEYTISGWPSEQPYPEWLKVEFLAVEGTNATVRVTMHLSNGTEQNTTVAVTIGAGGGETFGLSGFVIPANLTVGDSVYISGYGNVTIAGETTGTYAGAIRTVVYASFSQYGTYLTYYWDKLTGVVVEASITSASITATARATETNMWPAEITYIGQTIYIRSDGTIAPSDAPIQCIGDVYTLTSGITCSADGIVIERNNTIIEGANHVLLGSGYGNGITIIDRYNVTLRNMTIKNFAYGVFVRDSINSKIIRNNISCSRAIDIEMYIMGRHENTSSLIAENNIKYQEWGVRFSHISNNVLQENNISCSDPYSSDSTGVKLYCSSSNLITQNRIIGGQLGITLVDSPFNYIDQNIISTSRSWRYWETCGISLECSALNVISGNNITENFYGLRIAYSYEGYRNAIYHNNFINNTYSVKIENFPDNAWDIGYPSGGNYWSDYNGSDLFNGPYQNETGSDGIGDTPHIIDENNMDKYPLMEPWSPIPQEVIYIRADGSIDPEDAPIRQEGDIYILTEDINGSITLEKDNIILDGRGHTLLGTGAFDSKGIFLSERDNVTIKNVEVRAFCTGIIISDALNCKVYRNRVVNNLYALRIHQSSNNSLVENNVIGNIFMGIWLEHCSDSWIYRNNITSDNYGLILSSSLRNVIHKNDIIGNAALGAGLSDSSNNTISGNTVRYNYYGIYLYSSSYNHICYNSFINNVWQAKVYGNSSANIWDDGHLFCGNYWSNYNGTDLYNGAFQNVTGSDGIGDTPYIIDADNVDNYPLMSPYEYWTNPISGDINRDMEVNYRDLFQLAYAYGSSPAQPNWNPNADINKDDKVNYKDLFILASNFGRRSSQ